MSFGLLFLCLALVAAVIGFGWGASATIGVVEFFITAFLLVAIVSLIAGRRMPV